jgi:hypothetical protein
VTLGEGMPLVSLNDHTAVFFGGGRGGLVVMMMVWTSCEDCCTGSAPYNRIVPAH